MLGTLGWVILGAVLTGALLRFWDDIRAWLNNTAANVVQRYIGYDARKAMQRAVCVADRVMNKLRNTSKIYYKKNAMDDYLDVVTVRTSAPIYEFDEEIQEKLSKQGQLEQQFGYKG